jgi:transposase-like protein
MRYPVSEKLEIIRLVDQSHLPVKRTLATIGVSRPTFYRWYDLYRRFGEAGLEDRRGRVRSVRDGTAFLTRCDRRSSKWRSTSQN